MSEPFLITGLPRSRTAWMAAVALNEQSWCIHEPLRHLARWEDVFDTVWGGGAYPSHLRYVGVSDHALGFHLETIMRKLAPRTLIIERPIGEVNASLAKLGLPATNFCAVLQERLAFQHPSIMRVAYAALASSEVVVTCLRHLMPMACLRQFQIEALQGLNIQANDIAGVIAHGQQRGTAGDASALLGADVVAQLRVS